MKQRTIAMKIGISVARISVLVYLGFGALLYVRQDAYIFFPVGVPMAECSELPNARIVNMNGTRGYFLHATSIENYATSTRIAVIYHGNGERACDSAFMVPFLGELGYDLLLVEYAGYAGDTSVSPSVKRLIEDTRNAVMWTRLQNYAELTIIGRSIGTGFASYHALLAHPDRLLLISPFDVYSRTASDHYPMYPVKLMLKSDMNNIENAASAKRVLIIHGENDAIIPLEHAQALFSELPDMDKRLLVVPNVEHNDVLDPPDAWNDMNIFLK